MYHSLPLAGGLFRLPVSHFITVDPGMSWYPMELYCVAFSSESADPLNDSYDECLAGVLSGVLNGLD